MKSKSSKMKKSEAGRAGGSGAKARLTSSQRTRTVTAPTAVGTICYGSLPSYTSGPDGEIRIRRRELVKTLVLESGTFVMCPESIAVPGLDLSPTSTVMFPWLARIASRYERFQFHSIKFELVTGQPTTVGGRVYLAVDYDYADVPATSAAKMMSNRSSVEGPVWANLSLQADPRELHPDMPFKYCNPITKGNFVEPRTAFSGFLMVAASGVTSDPSPTVDLWVTYDVTLRVPVLEDGEEETTNGPIRSGAFPEIVTASSGLSVHIPALATPAGSLLPVVVPGSPGTPTMMYDGTLLPNVFDLTRAVATGLENVKLNTTVNKAGVTPAALYALLGHLRPYYALFDGAGTFVSTWGSSADTIFSVVGDPADGPTANWTTAGGSIRLLSTLTASQITKVFPLVRFLAPMWTSGFSVAGCAFSSRMSLEL